MRKKAFYIFLLLIILSPYVCAGEKYTLPVDDWDRPQTVKSVSTIKPLPEVMTSWSKDNHQKIDIRYPGGEMGQLLANQLRDWLVVLGVPSSAIILSPGSAEVTQLELLVQ